jgi:hypothetical protein
VSAESEEWSGKRTPRAAAVKAKAALAANLVPEWIAMRGHGDAEQHLRAEAKGSKAVPLMLPPKKADKFQGLGFLDTLASVGSGMLAQGGGGGGDDEEYWEEEEEDAGGGASTSYADDKIAADAREYNNPWANLQQRQWVQCDACDKWRGVPQALFEQLQEDEGRRWECKDMQEWRVGASCEEASDWMQAGESQGYVPVVPPGFQREVVMADWVFQVRLV